MPSKSAKGKEKEIDPDLTETDPGLTETDPDLTQSDPDLIDADDDAAGDEQQAGPSSVFYCGKCGEHLDGRIGPLCWNCEGSETRELRKKGHDHARRRKAKEKKSEEEKKKKSKGREED
ncbi:hypothetical protein MRS44_011517 [Fusarium solani]|uniref:uncharacterized protein n=1 Tax=Fusarium solani TaxID=169388 RepID=UPI0032C3F66E|nr:hypothetical protein MRS44_011517 [Fusarium solani]